MATGASQSSAGDSGSNPGDAMSQYLDLSRAFKRKKMQQVGMVWKNKDCLIVVRKKKPFKPKQLKGLKELLPEKSRRGTLRSNALLVAVSKTNVQLLFQKDAHSPAKTMLVKAIKRQSGVKVQIEIATYKDDPREALQSLKNEGKGKAAK
jgi:hypothetical protein